MTITKEELAQYYITEDHTRKETTEHFNICDRTLYKYMKQYGLCKQYTRMLTNFISKEQLEKHLIEEGLTYAEIAKLYNKKPNAIAYLNDKYRIKIPKEITQKARERTNFIKYGAKTPLKNPEVQAKSEQTSMAKYGCKKAADSKEVRARAGKSIKKARIRNHTTQAELIKNPEYLNNFITKRRISLSKNKTAGKSKDEKIILELLREKFDNVHTQYTSEKYPFNCDFYVPALDLYIEYQGFWMHGKADGKIYGAFDEQNEEHQTVLEKWKDKSKKSQVYTGAIRVWTIRDPLKRQTAKDNNLNWIEFWTVDEVKEWLRLI